MWSRWTILLGFVVVIGIAGSAEAGFVLRITDTMGTVDTSDDYVVVVADGDDGSSSGHGVDSSTTAGVIKYKTLSFSGNFDVDVTLARTNPVVGTVSTAEIQMSGTVTTLTGATGTIIVELTNTGMSSVLTDPLYFSTVVDCSLASSSATFSSVIDASSSGTVEFATTSSYGVDGTIGPDTYTTSQATTTTTNYITGGYGGELFSLSQIVTLVVTASDVSNTFTYTTTAYNPEPASLVAWSLLSGAAGLGWLRRRRRAA